MSIKTTSGKHSAYISSACDPSEHSKICDAIFARARFSSLLMPALSSTIKIVIVQGMALTNISVCRLEPTPEYLAWGRKTTGCLSSRSFTIEAYEGRRRTHRHLLQQLPVTLTGHPSF